VVDSRDNAVTARDALLRLRAGGPVVLPSLLMCDFGNLEREIAALEEAGVEGLHLDVMDGHFVPNLTYGLPIVRAIRRVTDLLLDVHLMIENPQQYVDQFRDAGADSMTVHVEAAGDLVTTLRQIRASGAGVGLALNPSTPLAAIEPFLSDCDLLLVMSVMPGFGGQQFNPVALEKLRRLKATAGPDRVLQVDGGVDPQTAGPCGAAGADLLVAGSAIFRSENYVDAVTALTAAARGGRVGPRV
jgi:ribulose-phosphate 3-epimerase